MQEIYDNLSYKKDSILNLSYNDDDDSFEGNEKNSRAKTLGPGLLYQNNLKSKPEDPNFNMLDSKNIFNYSRVDKNKDQKARKSIWDFFLSDKKEDEEEESEEEDEYNYNDSNKHQLKARNILYSFVKTKKEKEWKEYMDTYKQKVREVRSIRFKLKTIFHIDSDFIVIWKTTLRIFHIFILFIFLFKYVFITLAKSDSSLVISDRYLLIYKLVNIMFMIDLFFSVLILIFNGGSKLTYFKLPLKIYVCIPFELKKENFYYLLPKFVRIDIFQKIFSSWESYINLKAEFYIQNYQLKIFITFLTQIGKYLLIFGLYAHINCCVLAYFENLNYASSLFYTIEAFTVIGFGEQSPKKIKSIFLVILNLFVGVNLFSLMTSNIKNLLDKINSFSRDTSYWDNFESMTFQIQKSTGRILPEKIKNHMISYLLFRNGLSSKDIKEEFEDVLNSCNNNLLDEIRQQIFKFLKLEYQNFFMKNDDEFMYDIFINLKPKIFKKNQILIKYGQKVKKLYFLLSGQIYATNSQDKPIYGMIDNSIFGDYEFITNSLSYFNIKVSPKRSAYGFVLDKESWEKISNNHIHSAKYFIKQINKKRKTHMKWINKKENPIFADNPEIIEEENDNSFKNDKIANIQNNIFENKNNSKENEKIINIKNIKNEKIEKNKKMVKIDSILEKNPKFNISNIDIIRNIDELQTKINKIEFHFIDNKKIILQELKEKNI